jgi:(2Fe-2S) ferredoxin
MADACIVIEHDRWPPQSALEKASLPDAVKAGVQAAETAMPGLALFFIRRINPTQPPFIYVAITAEAQPRLYRALQSDVNFFGSLPALLTEGQSGMGVQWLHAEPLYLICTDGKRDRCCAKFGLPIYNEAKTLMGNRARQSSHIGGDRFAPTLVRLPEGLYYGHLTTPDVRTIIDAHGARRVYLPKYRGRMCYDFVVQAADYFLRDITATTDWDAFPFDRSELLRENVWRVTFRAPSAGAVHALVVERYKSDVLVLGSCASQTKSPSRRYQLLSHEILSDSE